MTPRERYNAYWQALPPAVQPLAYELWLERELTRAWAYMTIRDYMDVTAHQYYIVDCLGIQQGDSTRKPFTDTLEQCHRAISYYRDMGYSGFPYSIVDAETDTVVSVHPREEEGEQS